MAAAAVGVKLMTILFLTVKSGQRVMRTSALINYVPSQCFSPNAALHIKDNFHPQVKAVCQAQKANAVK